MPYICAQSVIHRDSPLTVSRTLALVFRFCSAAVAHLQFSLLYGPFTSTLSMLCFGVGFFPMSSQNDSNDASHL